MIAVRKTPTQKLTETGFQAHEREMVKLAIGLGFSVDYPHNKAHVLVESEEKIARFLRELDLERVSTSL
jgi:hypothetical protein